MLVARAPFSRTSSAVETTIRSRVLAMDYAICHTLDEGNPALRAVPNHGDEGRGPRRDRTGCALPRFELGDRLVVS